MSFAFTRQRQKQFKDLLRRYPDRRSVALPALHLAQEQEGFLTRETIANLAGMLGLAPAELMDTVSFYSLFHTEPQGRYLLQVCQTLSCSLAGADSLVDRLAARLKIKVGETTEDGQFTLLKVECLGGCDGAPVVQINNDYFERLSWDKLDRLLARFP